MRSSIRTLLRVATACLATATLGACAAQSGGAGTQGSVQARLAEVALRTGNSAGAVRLADRALTARADDTRALLVRGEAYTRLGELDAADKDFTRVLAARPDAVAALIGLGRLRLADDPAAAAALFRRALDHAPGESVALNDLGIALDLQGQHAAAEHAYRRALLLRPDLTAARVNLALSLALGGQGAAAVAMLRPVASAPKADAKLREDYAAVLTMAGEHAQAQAILSADMPASQASAELDAIAAGVPAVQR